jgi:hypothetical protein
MDIALSGQSGLCTPRLRLLLDNMVKTLAFRESRIATLSVSAQKP